MSTLTTNLGLIKPDVTDHYSIDTQNTNMELIDSAIGSKAEQSEVEELKKSVSDGKTLVANAVTAKGVSTATDATFATMASNIGNIKVGIDTSGATATAEQILSGAVAYGNNKKLVGSMPQQISISGVSPVSTIFHCYGSSYAEPNGNNVFMLPPKGYYDGNTFVGIKDVKLNVDNIKAGVTIGTDTATLTGTFTADATATADKILNGATAYVNGNKITGTAVAGKKYATGTLYGVKAATVQTYANVYMDEEFSTNTMLRGFTVTCDFVPELIVYTAGYSTWNGYFMGFVSNNTAGEINEPSTTVFNGKTVYIGRHVCNFATTIGTSTNIAIWSTGNTTTLDITWYAFG